MDSCPFEFWDETTLFAGKFVSEKQIRFRKKAADAKEGVCYGLNMDNSAGILGMAMGRAL